VSNRYDDDRDEEGSVRNERVTSHIEKKQLLNAHYIFGDFDDLPPNSEHISKQVRLEDIYDPAELKRKYETELDKQIKITDVPERMQLSSVSFIKPSIEELQEESEWIWKQRKKRDHIQILKDILQSYRNELLEIPFIYTYRKQKYKDTLTKQDLWEISNLDRQWRYMNEQKQRLLEQTAPIIEEYKRFSSIVGDLKSAQSLPELEDYRGFVNFYQALVAAGRGQGLTQKLSAKQIYLEKWVQQRIPELAEKLFLRSWDFADNLIHNQLLCAPPDLKESLSELAKRYSTSQHDENYILKTASKYAAEELSMLPVLRKFVREFYLKYALISTEPTTKGEAELDVFNLSYRVKRIFKRPVTSFYNDLWLDVKDHESRGFIKIKITIDEDRIRELTSRLLSCYILSIESSADEKALQYRVTREETLHKALREYLFPYAEAQVREALTEQSQDFILKKCAEKFKNKLMAGPYRVHNAFNEPLEWAFPETDPGVRVLSFVVDTEVERRPPVQMAAVDQYGVLLGEKLLYNLIFKSIKMLGAEDKQLYDKDIEECKNFIRDYKPDLIVVGANRLEAQSLRDRLRVLIEQKAENNDNASDSGMGHQNKGVWVAWGDPTIPKIYSTTEIAAKQMPDASTLLRMAVSQARLKQDAMSEMLNLWNHTESSNDLFSFVLHPLQKLVNVGKLEETLEQVAVECVNDVGIDINKVVDHPHLTNKLSFICGLGPRKAHDIIMTLKKKGKLETRIELRTLSIPGLGEVVYKNCIGFIKVFDNMGDDRYRDSVDDRLNRDLLGLTRIHPESYFIAKTIATDCIMEGASTKEFNKQHNSIPIEKILKDPSRLNKLSTDKVKEQLDKTNQESSKYLVDFVIQELRHPFKDPRSQHKDLSNEKLFYLLMGETKQSFYDGMLVSATVMRVNPSNSSRLELVRCKLENGVDAIIRPNDIADEYESDPEKKVTENSVIPARIKRITKGPRIEINLTIKKTDLSSHKNWVKLSEEDRKYFHIPESDLENKKMMIEQKRPAHKYYLRRLTHNSFKNLSCSGAIEYLRNKEIGDFIFRPSSKGEDHLTLTYKFYKNTYSHIDIVETNKQPGMNIGQKLFIDREEYESLDEIEARYIMPIIQFANEVAGHRKFVGASSMKVIEEHLTNELQKYPDYINYCFTILSEFPQYVILAYILQKDTIIKEYIRVKAQGYFFHGKFQKSLASLIAWFKQNFSTPEYQRFLRKYNKVPIVTTKNPEVHRKTNEGEWSEIKKDWQNEEDKAKPFPPDNPGINLKDDKANTVYLPKTDYNKYNISSVPRESSHSNYQGQFSTYENKGHRDESRGRDDKYGRKPITCYNCNKEGHMSRNCPEPNSRRGPSYRADTRSEGRRRSRGDVGPRITERHESWGNTERVHPKDVSHEEHSYRQFNTYEEKQRRKECHNCGQEGHIARDCPRSSYQRRDHVRGERRGDRRGNKRSRSRSQEKQPKESWKGKVSSDWEHNEGNKVDDNDQW